MDTKELMQITQNTLTLAMLKRSAPSGGLPIAFRSILLNLGNRTIMSGNAFESIEAPSITGDVSENYYKVGEDSFTSDISSMSDEPFPLITPYRKKDKDDKYPSRTRSFKNKLSGKPLQLRYMVMQFSRLGYEYMKNMKYFPKTYDLTNQKEIVTHVKSHVPAQLFRSTVFRTQGRGADMYPMNPAEIFYTMYEMIENGYDIPVEKLSAFKGFDLGSSKLSIFMKPEALYSLFNTGLCSFKAKIEYEIDIQNKQIVIKEFPYHLSGRAYDKSIERVLKKNNYRFKTFTVDPKGLSLHDSNREAFKMSNIVFRTRDVNDIHADFEANFFGLIYSDYYHFAHEVDIELNKGSEGKTMLRTPSVRDTLIECIENFKEITALRYQSEIEDIQEKIRILSIYEKYTRPHVADHIYEFQRKPGRDSSLLQRLLKLHNEDPKKYPEPKLEEIRDYIYNRSSNNILANLDNLGYDGYLSKIKNELRRIEELKECLKPENILNEARETYLELSKENDFKRISPIYFVNSSLSIEKRERLLDFVSIFESGKLPSKIHYYGGNCIFKTSGENLPEQYIPSYTLNNQLFNTFIYQQGYRLFKAYGNVIPTISSKIGYINGDIKAIIPYTLKCIYLTNLGRVGITDRMYTMDGCDGYPLLPQEHFIDLIPLQHLGSDAGIIVSSNHKLEIIPIGEFYQDWEDYHGNLVNSERYQGIIAIEVVDDIDNLKGYYIWCSSDKKFMSMNDVAWDKLNFPLNEHYVPVILSSNKKAYLKGIHIPLNQLNEIIGSEFKPSSFIKDMDIPTDMKSYISYVSPNIEENSEEELTMLDKLMEDQVNTLIMSGYLKNNKQEINKLAGLQFIREI